jgi:hypothetical protein
MRPLADLVERLCRASAARPAPRLDWPAHLGREQWFVSPELLSLAGTPECAALSEPARQRLSFYEAVNFFSLNLHGERFLLRGLAQRAATPAWSALAPYLEHFRAEEERHMEYFGEFCRRYAGAPYRDHTLALAREYDAGEDEVLFFARVLIFEEIADAHNRRLAADERLAPLARQINRLHHLDETRHLAFGRAMLPALFVQHAPAWHPGTLARVGAALAGYVTATWRAYYNPEVYRDAGLGDAYRLRERAFADPRQRTRRRAFNRRCLRVLFDHRILTEEDCDASRA